jgi:Family of unknown function (DUF6101)
MASGPSAGSSRAFRLDPLTLPVRYAGPAPATAFTIDRDRVVMQRSIRNKPATTIAVPVASYRGVSVRMMPVNQAGDIRVIVELMHRDPMLTLPLIIADEPEDVAADWQAWGRALNLPLLVIEQDGTVKMPIERIGAITVSDAKPRRRHAYFADRRPRFLVRRKNGRPGPVERIAGREIIAPE